VWSNLQRPLFLTVATTPIAMSSLRPKEAEEKEAVDQKPKEEELKEQAEKNAGSTKLFEKKPQGRTDGESAGKIEETGDESDEEKREDEKSDVGPTAQLIQQQHDWQAIYSPQYNAYYFYNTKTQETTWNNPLEPQASTSTSATSAQPTRDAASAIATASQPQANPALEGIDPELAYLDPTLASGGPSNPAGSFSARFNARTGRFTPMDGRDPSHLSEYERMKRMSSVFFDMNAWEQEVAKRKAEEDADAAEGRRRKKKPTKADLVRHSSPHGVFCPFRSASVAVRVLHPCTGYRFGEERLA